MQMGAGGAPGFADFADNVSSFYLLVFLHADFAQVAEHGDQAIAMINHYGSAIKKVITGLCDYPVSGRLHG